MLKENNKKRVVTIVSMMVLAMLLMSVCVCFADVGDDVANGITQAITTIRKIINPIATVAVIGCGVYCIMGSDPQNIQKAKKWGIAIFIGLVLINLASPIVNWASSIGK